MRPLFAIAALVPVLAAVSSGAQTAASISGHVADSSGQPIVHAHVVVTPAVKGGDGFTGSDGSFVLKVIAGQAAAVVHVTASGFRALDVPVGTQSRLVVTLTPAGPEETVTVSAYGAPLSAGDTPASTLIISRDSLNQTTGQALDDKLRQVAGFELFRRTSSLVSNPTSQGLSLRGLGSTAASRTLVLSDEDPLNDPYGGWIHWDEIPELAVQSVTIVRGGASDLYGSSAIGGVLDLTPVRPASNTLQLLSSYGSLNTFDEAALASGRLGKWSGLATGGLVRTDGYTLVAPQSRGAVDIPSNVDMQNGRVEVDKDFSESGSIFLRGNLLNEARSNGTPLTTNGTRLWRMESGAD